MNKNNFIEEAKKTINNYGYQAKEDFVLQMIDEIERI